MRETHYLIVGASHAALAALNAIRNADGERPLTLVAKDDALPYSPTVLPYVVSGRSEPAAIALRDDDYFRRHKVDYLRGRSVTGIDAAARRVRLADGEEIGYRKLLLATGAAPLLPPVEGLREVPFHVLRSLDDALKLREALRQAKEAVVLGGGLIGMHAAENLAKAGARVSVVERAPQVLPAYFDAEAASLIEAAFRDAGVTLVTGATALQARQRDGLTLITLDNGTTLAADLLLVGTGVAPATACLADTGITVDRGVLVDEVMRTSAADVWAAGDVAQARDFYGPGRVLNGILPDAVEQGRIAGMSMAGDAAVKAYPGAVPLNAYHFFGRHALAVGAQECEGGEILRRFEPEAGRYLKVVIRDDRLMGIFGIGTLFDAGVMWELILRRIDLGAVKARFLADPMGTARVLMSCNWR